MRQNARKELAKREREEEPEKKEERIEEKPPSLLSGISLIFAGSVVFSVFLALEQIFIGFIASAAFIIVGMFRVSKANAARYRNKDQVAEE